MTAISTHTGTEFFGHPKALVICFLTEMWERFSYYGMRALLIFYLTQHFLFSDEVAAGIFGSYISLVYITPVLGGIIADRYLGASKAVILGAILLVAGHLGMALEGTQAIERMGSGVHFIMVGKLYLFNISQTFSISPLEVPPTPQTVTPTPNEPCYNFHLLIRAIC